MQITEPITTLTDYALALASAYFALTIARQIRPQTRTCGTLWALGFAAGALAAFLGGTFHGFVIRSLWNVTVLSIGASGAFMVAGVLASSINKRDESRRWLWAGVAVSLSSFAVQLTGFRRGLDFNHNDLFHVMQIVAQYFFFRGAALLKDR